jgi:hypothetical protein
MIVIQTGFNPTTPLTHSRIGMNNIGRTGTVSASSEAVGFPAIAANNPLTYEFWKPTSTPAWWKIDAGTSTSVNYVGIASHTLGTDSGIVSVQYSTDNSNWTTVDTHTPTDNSPIMFLFAPVSARYWRIYFTSSTPATVGVVYIGTTLDMQRACYSGLSPIDMSRRSVVRTNVSEGGQWLGRTVIRQGSEMAVGFRHLDYDWYKDNFDPFAKDALSYPFFFAWRPQGYPETVGYVWVSGDIAPSTMGIRDLVEVSFDMQGLAIE